MIKQLSKSYIGYSFCGNRWMYVSELRGQGGKDWGYTFKPSKALVMSERMARVFVNELPGRYIV